MQADCQKWMLRYDEWVIELRASPNSKFVQTLERQIDAKSYGDAEKQAISFIKIRNKAFAEDAQNILSPKPDERHEYRMVFLAGIFSGNLR